MATPHAVEIVLSAEEREHLEKLLRKQTAERRAVGRARIVLLAADGLTNQQIAEATGYARWTVTTWRQRRNTSSDNNAPWRSRSPAVTSRSARMRGSTVLRRATPSSHCSRRRLYSLPASSW